MRFCFLRLAASRSAGPQREVIDGCFAIDLTGDSWAVGVAPYFSEIERFGRVRSDAQALLHSRFIHGRYARLHVGEEGARYGRAACQEIRLHRALDECRKQRSRDRVARVHSSQLCRSFVRVPSRSLAVIRRRRGFNGRADSRATSGAPIGGRADEGSTAGQRDNLRLAPEECRRQHLATWWSGRWRAMNCAGASWRYPASAL